MNTRLLVVVLVLAVCCLAGCPGRSSESGTAAATPDGEATSESGYKRRPVEKLPVVDDYLPPLDDGRIEVAGPEGWKPLPRSSKSLASFVKGKASELPRIVVTAGDPPAADLGDTTEENAETLTTALDSQLRSDSTKEVPEHCLPIILGDRVFIRHVRLANMAGDPVVIQSLQTIVGGRLYTVELICDVNAANRLEYVKSLTLFRDYGYAVAANLKFGGATDPLAGVAAEKPPAEKPAEKPPEISPDKPAKGKGQPK